MEFTEEQRFAGPFPRPETLQGYEDIVEGSAAEIIRAGVARIDANSEIMKEAAATKNKIDLRGQIIAGIVVVLFLATASLWIYWGYENVGFLFAGSLLLSLVIAFLSGTRVGEVAGSLLGRVLGKEERSEPNSFLDKPAED